MLEKEPSKGRKRWWVRRNAQGLFGGLVVILIVVTSILAPYISSHDPNRQDIEKRLMPPSWARRGSSDYLLGTDYLGRDVFSRIIYGARVSLLVAGLTILMATSFGMLIGILAGYFEGITGAIIMTIVDGQLSFPFLLLAIAIAAVLGASLINVILVLILTSWVRFARLTYGLVLSVKRKDFVVAARAVGASNTRIMRLHIFPQILTPNVAAATVFTGQIVLAEAALSFLGIGVSPMVPTWGTILSDGRDYLASAPWITFYPGIALMITVLGVALLGDWMRTVVDPKQR